MKTLITLLFSLVFLGCERPTAPDDYNPAKPLDTFANKCVYRINDSEAWVPASPGELCVTGTFATPRIIHRVLRGSQTCRDSSFNLSDITVEYGCPDFSKFSEI